MFVLKSSANASTHLGREIRRQRQTNAGSHRAAFSSRWPKEAQFLLMIAAIPAWNSQGVLPPVDPNDPVSRKRSPYVVSLLEVMRRFSTSPERITILEGLLRYRAALHAAGLQDGFQWLDGSFLENKEARLGVAPGDIDVVTFFTLPSNTTEPEVVRRAFSLFDPGRHEDNKRLFHVDAYFQPLYVPSDRLVIGSNYWYGMWSHQRDTFLWKGFLQVPLSSLEDAAASTLLATLAGGATP